LGSEQDVLICTALFVHYTARYGEVELSDKDGKEPSLAFGGQALIEGVMIRSRSHMVMCVRKPNKEIVTNVEKVESVTKKYRALGIPFIRGIVALPETMYLGFKGLFFSANSAFEGEEEEESISFGFKEIAAIIGLAAGIAALFFLVPFFLATWLGLTGILFNVVEAIIRLSLFIGYLAAVATWGEFARVLQYHGAEHKAINALEAGAPMDVENVKRYSRLHPRCGTSFIFFIVIVSIMLFTVMPDYGFWWRLAYRVLLIPVIAGISYELLRLSGKYRNSPATKVLTAPGLLFQRLTTKEPSDDMLEVSIKAVTEAERLTWFPTEEAVIAVPNQ
jgi:uncharacterized protein YqhQ